jgi:nucleoside-diphosphate-sugar epimerase
MSTILITGASGFIGKALASSLADKHDAICMSRKDPGLGLPYIRGEISAQGMIGRDPNTNVYFDAVSVAAVDAP